MGNIQYDLLKNAEAQSNDSTVFKVDLPRDGHILEIDLVIACTNGSTSNAGYSNGGTAGERIEATIDEVKIIGNGSKEILSVTAIDDLIAEAIKITGKVPARYIDESASAVQTLYVPIFMGRFPNDTLVCLPNGAYQEGNFWDSLQIHIKYSPTIAATAFATGTMTFTLGVYKLTDGSSPVGKLVKLFKKKEDYTTLASGDKKFALTYGQNILYRAVQIYCYEAGIAEGVDFTSLVLKTLRKGGGTNTEYDTIWTLQQRRNANRYQLSELNFAGRALCSDTDVISTLVPSPEYYAVKPELYTVSAALATLAVVESRAGDQLTLGVWHIGDTAAAYTTDQAVYWQVKANVIPRYVYLDWDESRTLENVLDTSNFAEIVLTATNGGAGGTVRINEELIMSASDFRGS